jgi:hypothetical protein
VKRSTTASRRSSRFDFANRTFEVGGVVPELEVTGPYKLEGKILLLPHMKYVSGKTKIQPGSVFFRFENLFNRDKCDANSNQHGQQILCQSVNRGGF